MYEKIDLLVNQMRVGFKKDYYIININKSVTNIKQCIIKFQITNIKKHKFNTSIVIANSDNFTFILHSFVLAK